MFDYVDDRVFEEVNEDEIILEFKWGKRGKEIVVIKMCYIFERLNVSCEDFELIENEMKLLWKVLDVCFFFMEEL